MQSVHERSCWILNVKYKKQRLTEERNKRIFSESSKNFIHKFLKHLKKSLTNSAVIAINMFLKTVFQNNLNYPKLNGGGMEWPLYSPYLTPCDYIFCTAVTIQLHRKNFNRWFEWLLNPFPLKHCKVQWQNLFCIFCIKNFATFIVKNTDNDCFQDFTF